MTEDQIFGRIAKRLLPFIMLLYVVNYIDRVNVGFAALTMNKDLGLSPAVFGLGASIFFIGYMIFQVPANLMLEKFGARRWMFTILAIWGLISACKRLHDGAIQLLRAASSARHRGSRLLPGHAALYDVLVSAHLAQPVRRHLHGGHSAVEHHRRADFDDYSRHGRHLGPAWLAMDVHPRRSARDRAGVCVAEAVAGPSSHGVMADG
jgi:hypothetical protein